MSELDTLTRLALVRADGSVQFEPDDLRTVGVEPGDWALFTVHRSAKLDASSLESICDAALEIVTGSGTPKARTGYLDLPDHHPHFQVECLCGGTLDTRRALRQDSEAFAGVPCPECGQTWTIEATPERPRVQAVCREDAGQGP